MTTTAIDQAKADEQYDLTAEGAVGVEEARRMLGLGLTRTWQLVRDGQLLTTQLPGVRRRLILRSSIRRLLAEGMEK